MEDSKAAVIKHFSDILDLAIESPPPKRAGLDSRNGLARQMILSVIDDIRKAPQQQELVGVDVFVQSTLLPDDLASEIKPCETDGFMATHLGLKPLDRARVMLTVAVRGIDQHVDVGDDHDVTRRAPASL